MAGAADSCRLLAERASQWTADPGAVRQGYMQPCHDMCAGYLLLFPQVVALCPGPSRLKIFANKESLDFDSAKSEKPTQELKLRASDVRTDQRFNLLTAKYRNVYALTILVRSLCTGLACQRI